MSDIDIIWSRLNAYISNPYGTAGLMGNLQSESGLIPYRLQDDFTPGYTKSVKYTQDVDSGVISRNTFINDGKGYGLAQWTYFSRKRDYYDFKPLSVESIGSVYRGVDFLIYELQNNYPSVWSVLINATSIRQASDKVLHDYENPKEQGVDVEIYRESLGIAIYNQYSPLPPVPVPGASAPIWLLAQALRKI